MSNSTIKQLKLIPKIKKLCIEGRYDEAIKLSNKIEIKTIAAKAHLLCMEHERSRKIARINL